MATLFHSILLLSFLSLFLPLAFSAGEDKPKVPAIFIFGDSTVDVGNNNDLPSSPYKADHYPYGIDYPPTQNATGRFSNGYNGADYMAQHMGFDESPPPFYSLFNNVTKEINIMQALKKGINFASGGSKLIDWEESSDTVISMTEQIKNFTEFRSQLTKKFASGEIDPLFSKSIFFISIGGNDLGAYAERWGHITFDDFKSNFTTTYRQNIKELYDRGGRKFGVVNVPTVGCCPQVKLLFHRNGCVEKANDWANHINNELKLLMNDLSSKLMGMQYSIADSFYVFRKIMENPGHFGFTDTKTSCCGSGISTGCNQNATICPNRYQYLFWDGMHPTNETAKIFADLVYNDGLKQFAYPVNFKELAEGDNNLISVY